RLWPKQRDQHTMEANELRALQAPLKKRYREQPATALTPGARRGHARRGSHRLPSALLGRRDRRWPASGHRRRREPCLLRGYDLEALVACAGVTVSAVATARG